MLLWIARLGHTKYRTRLTSGYRKGTAITPGHLVFNWGFSTITERELLVLGPYGSRNLRPAMIGFGHWRGGRLIGRPALNTTMQLVNTVLMNEAHT